jgi:large subunit ribosomal protein L28
MSNVCQLTGARPKSGNKVSHSNRKSKRRFVPNLIQKKVLDEKTGTTVTLKITARAARTLAKNPKKFQAEINHIAKKTLKRAAR